MAQCKAIKLKETGIHIDSPVLSGGPAQRRTNTSQMKERVFLSKVHTLFTAAPVLTKVQIWC